jgi:hypothetical protein
MIASFQILYNLLFTIHPKFGAVQFYLLTGSKIRNKSPFIRVQITKKNKDFRMCVFLTSSNGCTNCLMMDSKVEKCRIINKYLLYPYYIIIFV